MEALFAVFEFLPDNPEAEKSEGKVDYTKTNRYRVVRLSEPGSYYDACYDHTEIKLKHPTKVRFEVRNIADFHNVKHIYMI